MTKEASETNPSPPISISRAMTVCPNPLHCVQVSERTSPVTQVADVAVNSDSTNPAGVPSREAAGSDRRTVPVIMIPMKTRAMNWLTFIGRLIFGPPPDLRLSPA